MKARRKLLALVLVAVLVAAVSGSYTWSAFVANDDNAGNRIASGSVSIADNDSGAALVSFADAQPGDSDTGCVKVTYGGTLPASVRLFGTTGGTGLDQYLTVQVTRGIYNGAEPAAGSCTNFQADASNYIGAGAGVVYNGTLQGFADDYAAGIVDPQTWTQDMARVYRIQVTLQSDSAAAGLNASQAFTWEARNQ